MHILTKFQGNVFFYQKLQIVKFGKVDVCGTLLFVNPVTLYMDM